ncbi:MAG TPA: hypothetical protein VKZ48_05700, partial [Burkholderiales bacterium]|nr:hypothetical protein [Burkholderiales bacterium]
FAGFEFLQGVEGVVGHGGSKSKGLNHQDTAAQRKKDKNLEPPRHQDTKFHTTVLGVLLVPWCLGG